MNRCTVIARYSLCPLLGIDRADLRAIDDAATRPPDSRDMSGGPGEYVSQWHGVAEAEAHAMADRIRSVAYPRMRVTVQDHDVSDAR